MNAYCKTWISFFICTCFTEKMFNSMLQNQSNKILLGWFLSLSNIKQIKNFKTLDTGLVIRSTEDEIQYFMKLRLHKLISQWLNFYICDVFTAGSNHLLLATIKLPLIYNIQSLKPVYLIFHIWQMVWNKPCYDVCINAIN